MYLNAQSHLVDKELIREVGPKHFIDLPEGSEAIGIIGVVRNRGGLLSRDVSVVAHLRIILRMRHTKQGLFLLNARHGKA